MAAANVDLTRLLCADYVYVHYSAPISPLAISFIFFFFGQILASSVSLPPVGSMPAKSYFRLVFLWLVCDWNYISCCRWSRFLFLIRAAVTAAGILNNRRVKKGDYSRKTQTLLHRLIEILKTDQIQFRAQNESLPLGLNVRNSLNEITKDKTRLRDFKSHTKETHV